ncbi:hypothetical protein K443DRAFT_678986 [Laccaria amethystina LaAM-08-1]|uniref:Uncharacterized protein n=1 Tax=Laccaria amethystina LaAM-08-1 TaxID=1095629 RepID=A0A0C9XGG9_9AGAR|nr:hypothetical protein K443DRAFT_678986 [Laccaria amethystina LaAM-08-1]
MATNPHPHLQHFPFFFSRHSWAYVVYHYCAPPDAEALSPNWKRVEHRGDIGAGSLVPILAFAVCQVFWH